MLIGLHQRESLAARRIFVAVMAFVLAMRMVVPLTVTGADGTVSLCLGTERLVLPVAGKVADPDGAPHVEPCPTFHLTADAPVPAPSPAGADATLMGRLDIARDHALRLVERPAGYSSRAPPLPA